MSNDNIASVIWHLKLDCRPWSDIAIPPAGNLNEELFAKYVNADIAQELADALQMICDSGVHLASPIEGAMLDAIAKYRGAV